MQWLLKYMWQPQRKNSLFLGRKQLFKELSLSTSYIWYYPDNYLSVKHHMYLDVWPLHTWSSHVVKSSPGLEHVVPSSYASPPATPTKPHGSMTFTSALEKQLVIWPGSMLLHQKSSFPFPLHLRGLNAGPKHEGEPACSSRPHIRYMQVFPMLEEPLWNSRQRTRHPQASASFSVQHLDCM